MKRVVVLIFFVFNLLFGEKLILQMDVTCNEVGDATVTWIQKATAFQWKLLMQKYGNNPALLKKEIIYSLPGYDLSDFSYKKDEMNRQIEFSFKAKGVVVYKGNGIWHFKYDKEFMPRKINDTTWLFTNSESEEGLLTEQYLTLRLPQNAQNARLIRNEYDEPVLAYKISPPLWLSLSWMTIVGGIIFLIGIGVLLYGFISKGKRSKNS